MMTTVVTGANRGIGLALARHYRQAGYRVIGIVRNTSAELDDAAAKVIDGVELTDACDLAAVAAALREERIAQLLNVAGIMEWEAFETLDPRAIRRQFEVNALAPLALTRALSDQLSDGSRVIFLTSRLGSMADNTSGQGYGYRMSKAALNMAAKTLSIDLAPRGIAVALLHPGSVKTSLNQLGGEIEVDEAVRGLTARIAALTMATTGQYSHQNGTPLPW